MRKIRAYFPILLVGIAIEWIAAAQDHFSRFGLGLALICTSIPFLISGFEMRQGRNPILKPKETSALA